MKKSSLTHLLELLAVGQFVFSFFWLGILCTVLAVWLCFTRAWPVVILYCVWYIYDRNTPSRGGRRSHFIRHSAVWKYFSNYFPIKLVKTYDLDPNRNYLLACHPHGILSTSHALNFATEGTGFSSIFPKMVSHLMVLPSGFKFPFFREYFLGAGACSCLKDSLEYVLTKPSGGNAAAVIIGGAVEALYAQPGNFTLNLAHKKGFIKSALRTGASIVPVFAFGENNLYSQSTHPTLLKVQKWLREKLNVVLPIPYAICWLLPYRTPVSCVVGRPLDAVKSELPSQEEIDELHKVYVDSLNELFEHNKQLYGVPRGVHLKII